MLTVYGIGYKFTDSIILNTELEFEHGGANPEMDEPEGYAIVEFMYLDFLMQQAFNVQLGHLLVPMGLINMRHEPTLYNTVQKPKTEKYIIPSTWHSSGVMAYGTLGESGISYNAGIIQSLDLDNETAGQEDQVKESPAGSTGKSAFNKAALVGRLDYRGINSDLRNEYTDFVRSLAEKLDADGKRVDRVKSYFGMRKIKIGPDEEGVQRILLNGEPIFNIGTLDQGFWPDGIYTYAGDGETRYARMGFSDGVMRQVYGFTGEDGEGAPREIIPQPGDQFTILETWMDLDQNGKVSRVATQEGGTLTFGDQMFTWEDLDAAPGNYIVGFSVEDLDGNAYESFAVVTVE